MCSPHRLTKADFSLAATTDIVRYYDAANGTLTKITGPGTDLTYEYDVQRMTKETYSQTSESFELAYNAAGQRTKLVTPAAGETFAYTYDSDGRLQQIEQGGSCLIEYGYSATTGRPS